MHTINHHINHHLAPKMRGIILPVRAAVGYGCNRYFKNNLLLYLLQK
jgi:hypothetical protein